VIVDDLDVFGMASRAAKTDAELIVPPQAPLTSAIALQLFELVGRRRAEVCDAAREVEQRLRPISR